MCILGVDPGGRGALVRLNASGDLLNFLDMPTFEIKRGKSTKNEVDPHRIASFIKKNVVLAAALEKVGARPGQGVTSMFQFGRSTGMIEGVMAAHRVPFERVTPQAWRAAGKVRKGKDGSIARAIELWPEQADDWFRPRRKTKTQDGTTAPQAEARAEAALIALWCLQHSATGKAVAVILS